MENLPERLGEIYGKKKWVLAVSAAVAASRLHDSLTEWGSETMIVAATEGTGDLPDASIVYTRALADTIVGSIRAFFESVEDPAADVQSAVDAFDPDRSARVLAEPYATAEVMVGRKTFGVRRPAWSAWEDKMRVDALWEELEIPHAPYRIVDVEDAPDAANEVGGDLGSVWVADNSGGWHGGAEYVKWVATPEETGSAVEWFSDRARRVRIMPFLDGLPSSIHGWVTKSGVAVFLPVEILVLRSRDGRVLTYAGVSTLWDAPGPVTGEMRTIARRVGEALARSDGYRGPFGVDGVLTTEGFRPTELNPRMSAGAGVQLATVDVPLSLLMRAEIEGFLDVDHEWLESHAIDQRKPAIHLGKTITKEVRDSFHIGMEAGEVAAALSEDDSIGKLTSGPSATGSYVVGDFDVEKVGVGRHVGPLVASALNLASRRWGLGLPELVAAPSLVE